MSSEIDLPAQAGSDVDTITEVDIRFGNDKGTVDTNTPRAQRFGNDASDVGTNCVSDNTIGNDTIGFIRARHRKIKGGPRHLLNRRARNGTLATKSTSFDLVRAVRVNGKPRHQFVLGLGSQKDFEQYCTESFWRKAIYRLNKQGLDKWQRKRLLIQMVRKGAKLPRLEECERRWRPLHKDPEKQAQCDAWLASFSGITAQEYRLEQQREQAELIDLITEMSLPNTDRATHLVSTADAA